MGIRYASPMARFLAHVDKKSSPFGCWLWTGCTNKDGYGVANIEGQWNAHRAAFVLFKGEIPKGNQVCHDCPGGDNPACVNPAHLWLGTVKQHGRDRVVKGQMSRGRRHGILSHPITMRKHEGEAHWTRHKQERIARGDRHGSVTHPEKFKGASGRLSPKTQGDNHWTKRKGCCHEHMVLMSRKAREVRDGLAR